jgi:hypothetical protein
MMELPLWIIRYFKLLIMFCIISLASCMTAPVLGFLVPEDFLAGSKMVAASWGTWNLVCGVAIAGFMYLFTHKRSGLSFPWIVILVAVAYLCAYKVSLPVIENSRNMQTDIAAFIKKIEPQKRSRIAGCGFRENIRGFFYIISGWKISRVDNEAEIREILEGKNPLFDGVIISGKGTPPEIEAEGQPWHITAKTFTGGSGSHRRYLLLVERNQ